MNIIKGKDHLHNEGGGEGLRFAASVLQKMVNIAYMTMKIMIMIC